MKHINRTEKKEPRKRNHQYKIEKLFHINHYRTLNDIKITHSKDITC
jgi:hypothetical protein